MSDENKPAPALPTWQYDFDNPLATLLLQLIDAAPPENHGAIEVQVTLRDQPLGWNGATRRNAVDGVFTTTTLAQSQDPDTRRVQMKVVEVHFSGEDILRIDTFKDVEPSRIALAGPGDAPKFMPGIKR